MVDGFRGKALPPCDNGFRSGIRSCFDRTAKRDKRVNGVSRGRDRPMVGSRTVVVYQDGLLGLVRDTHHSLTCVRVATGPLLVPPQPGIPARYDSRFGSRR